MSEQGISKDLFRSISPLREPEKKTAPEKSRLGSTAKKWIEKPVSEKMLERMRIVIMGGGRVGVLLAKLLRAEKHQITMIEVERDRASRLAEMLPDVLIVNGDGSNIGILRDAGADLADIFISVTGSDTHNYVASQIAKKSLKVPKVIARVNDPANENNFIRVGIDKLVTTTKATAAEILEEISGGKTVLPLAGVRFEILYALLRDSSPMVGKRVARCGLPRKALIFSLNRAGQPMVPEDRTALRSGDLIAVLTPLDISEKVKSVLAQQ